MDYNLVFIAAMAEAELGRIKKHLEEGHDVKQLKIDFNNLLSRARLLVENHVSGARRFYWKLKGLEKLIFSSLRKLGITRVPEKVVIYFLEKRIDDVQIRLKRFEHDAQLVEQQGKLISLKI